MDNKERRHLSTGSVVTVVRDTKERAIRNRGRSSAGPGSCPVTSVRLKVTSRESVSRRRHRITSSRTMKSQKERLMQSPSSCLISRRTVWSLTCPIQELTSLDVGQRSESKTIQKYLSRWKLIRLVMIS